MHKAHSHTLQIFAILFSPLLIFSLKSPTFLLRICKLYFRHLYYPLISTFSPLFTHSYPLSFGLLIFASVLRPSLFSALFVHYLHCSNNLRTVYFMHFTLRSFPPSDTPDALDTHNLVCLAPTFLYLTDTVFVFHDTSCVLSCIFTPSLVLLNIC